MPEAFKFPHEKEDENIEVEVTDGDVEILQFVKCHGLSLY